MQARIFRKGRPFADSKKPPVVKSATGQERTPGPCRSDRKTYCTVSTSNRKAFKTAENPQLVSIVADTCTLARTLAPTTLRPMRRRMLRAVLAVGFMLSAPAFAQG